MSVLILASVRSKRGSDIMLTIRKLLPSDDRMTIGEIYAKSWKHAYKDLLPEEYLDSLTADEWANRLGRAGRCVLVAELDGKLIGTASYGESRTPKYAGQGEVYSIYFLPEYMGKGYGKQLMSAVLAYIKELGNNSTFLWVLEDNISARRFYEKIGFACSGEIKEAEIGGKTVREIKYTIQIGEG